MADTFIQVDTGDTCPQGSSWSEIMQQCLTSDQYRAMIQLAREKGDMDLALRLGVESGLIVDQGIVGGVLSTIMPYLLPVTVGLIGLVLVIIAVSSWVNTREIKIAGVPLPKVK